MNARIIDECNQIEMAAVIMEKPGHYTENDLADYFKISYMKIRRYKGRLKARGIDVYSRKNHYYVDLKLSDMNQMLITYMAFGTNEVIRNLKLIHERFKEKTLVLFVKITKAIRDHKVIEIAYETEEKGITWREVSPISFHNAGKTFYLIAIHYRVTKFFTLEHIHNVKFTNRKSDIVNPPSVMDLFKNTWGTFTGGEGVNIRLLFEDSYYKYLSERFWIENQQVVKTEDGVELRLKMKLSYEFISWVMGWGKNVKILEPEELKQEVLSRAKEIVAQYGN